MVYVNHNMLYKFHDDVAAFVRDTQSGKRSVNKQGRHRLP